ncbi:MAG: hypothetical protein ACREBS_09295 [Nitrososphaerales archaeon]
MNPSFTSHNRNKKSLELDFSSPDGCQILFKQPSRIR